MAGEGYFQGYKCFVVTLNIILVLVGVALLSTTLWLYFDSSQYVHVMSGSLYFSYLVMILAAIFVLVGTLGWSGACWEQQCVIGFGVLMLVVLIGGEITGGVLLYNELIGENGGESLKEGLKEIVEVHYGLDSHRTHLMDLIQQEFSCCGVLSPKDWSNSAFSRPGEKYRKLEEDVKDPDAPYTVPRSCCLEPDNIRVCNTKQLTVTAYTPGIHVEGCHKPLFHFMATHLEYFFIFAVSVLGLQILVFVTTLLFCVFLCRVGPHGTYDLSQGEK